MSRAREIPSAMAASALGAGLLVACAVVAGAQLGTASVALAIPVAIAAGLVRGRIDAKHAGLMHLAHVDPLTGLGNARQLRTRLGYEITRHHRHKRRLTVFVMDLDGFKSVNDRFGHAAGDEVLREVSRQLQRTVRDQDTVVRQGGDEFCVLAPETGWRDAESLAERLGEAVARAVAGLPGISASIGFGVFPDEGATPETLLAHADANQAAAKRRAHRARPELTRVA
jgi:diguanylate cyclase (GGDEF)-like protein